MGISPCLENLYDVYIRNSEMLHCILNYLFTQRKAGYIKRVAEILLNDYDSDIPSTFEELVSMYVRIYTV